MSEPTQTVSNFNLVYARKLVEDVSDEQMTLQPSVDGHVVPNHPAWVLGHVAYAFSNGAKMLGGEPVVPDDWNGPFGNGSTPVTDASSYPDKASLLNTFEEAHARVSQAFAAAGDAALAAENPIEGLRPMFPTVGELVTFIMTSHAMLHLGQLSAWRRAVGLPSVFG